MAEKAKTERQAAIDETKVELAKKSIDELTAEYVKIEAEKKEISAQDSAKKYRLDAIEEIMRAKVVEMNLDSTVSGGLKWEPRTEPKASVQSVARLKAYFIVAAFRDYVVETTSEEMTDADASALTEFLERSEHLAFLQISTPKIQSIIDEEAENNELDIEIKNEGTPEERTVMKSSRLPFVGVFPHETISVTKARSNKGRLGK